MDCTVRVTLMNSYLIEGAKNEEDAKKQADSKFYYDVTHFTESMLDPVNTRKEIVGRCR